MARGFYAMWPGGGVGERAFEDAERTGSRRARLAPGASCDAARSGRVNCHRQVARTDGTLWPAPSRTGAKIYVFVIVL